MALGDDGTGPDRAALAAPLVLPCGAVLANRLVKAAMSEQLADRGNGVSPELVHLYRRWAEGGCGLLVTGNVMVDRRAISEPRQVVVERDGDVRGLERLAAAAHDGGAPVWVQLNHGGRQVPRFLSRHATAPSAVPVEAFGLFGRPRPLTPLEIEDVIERFATAAAVAVAAGFDGVQIHAAHGYLLSQFLSPLANRRDDEWGGDADRRARMLLEVVRAVRSAVGAAVPVAVKLNSADFQRGGFDEASSMDVVERLEVEGIDLLEISGGTFESGAMMGAASARTRAREAYFASYAQEVRQRTRLPLMLTGGFRTSAAMAEAVARGTVDLVGLARPLVVDPSFAAGLLRGDVDGIDLAPRRVGSRQLDPLVEVAWYTRQIRRLGRGRDPSPGARAAGALATYLSTTVGQALGRRRTRPAAERDRRRSLR